MAIGIQVQCALFSIPAVLHLLSIYVLHLARHSNLKENQRLYFLNLSASEFLICFLGILKRICKIYNLKTAATYVRFIQAGTATFVYYFVMIGLTLDRFFEISLNIRYSLYFSKKRTLAAIGIVWTASLLFTTALVVLNELIPAVPNEVLTYFYFTFGIVCVVVSTFTYMYILRKLYSNKVGDIRMTARVGPPSLSRKRLLQSMYLPILLLMTFTIFVVIPETMYLYYDLCKLNMSDTLSTALTTSYFVAYTSDVFIYVLASKYIRNVILRKVGYKRDLNDTTVQSQTQNI